MYEPSYKTLKKYSDVLVKFALNGGKGIKAKEVVFLMLSESAKPILKPLMKSVLECNAFPLIKYIPEDIDYYLFENSNNNQIKYYPRNYLLERVKEIDHLVSIGSTNNKHELEKVDKKKILLRTKSSKFYKDALRKKEGKGMFTWTYALYGTEAMAREANLTLRDYWKQIIKACFLNYNNPLSKWREISKKMSKIKKLLNSLDIDTVQIKSPNTDLKIKIGKGRQWVGGSGRNIPSFEIFTSPDWRGTEGWMKSDRTIYRYGNLIEGIELEFKNGKVIKSKAKKNEKLLKEIIIVENANKIGEFSLTDKRFSNINLFMGETLYDENVGGKFGNFHIAIGSAFKDCYKNDAKNIKDKKLKKLGFNIDCAVHMDIISTDDRIVTAKLRNGEKKIIFKDGQFQID